jgi:hypothetical protein
MLEMNGMEEEPEDLSNGIYSSRLTHKTVRTRRDGVPRAGR